MLKLNRFLSCSTSQSSVGTEHLQEEASMNRLIKFYFLETLSYETRLGLNEALEANSDFIVPMISVLTNNWL